MKENLRNILKNQLDQGASQHSIDNKDIIWDKLDINKPVATTSSKLWQIISAILFLLLLLGTSLHIASDKETNEVNYNNVVMHEKSSELKDLKNHNVKLIDSVALLNEELTQLKKQLELQVPEKNDIIIYRDRIINKTDTVYIKREPITIYKDIVVTDTIYIEEPAAAKELLTNIESETQEERKYRRNVVQFDLRNQKDDTSESTHKGKSTISFGLNSKLKS